MVELNRKFILEKKFLTENLLLLRITHLEFNTCNINKINEKTFNGLINLEILSLHSNRIEEIGTKTFEGLINLRELYLYNNKLKKLIDLIGLKNLEILDLDNNYIEYLEKRTFQDLSELKELYIHGNQLKQIDSDIFKGIVKLERLSLSKNSIECINGNIFEGLSSLKHLFLHNNKLKRIDSNTFKEIERLQSLDLSYNEIVEIEENAFSRNLKLLYLNNNKLKKIHPKCFDNLKSIQVLELYENDEKIPSFLNSLIILDKCSYNKDKLEVNGSHSNWDVFLNYIHIIFYEFKNPRLLIFDYYDSLIHDIDIYTEEQIEKLSEEDLFSNFNLKIMNNNKKKDSRNEIEDLKFFEIDSIVDPYKGEYKFDLNQPIKVTSGSTKIRDYLNLVRSKSIEEIKQVREENLERYEINKKKCNYNRNIEMTSEKVEEIRRELFKEGFCFLLNLKNIFGENVSIPYEFVTIITDFYLDVFEFHGLIG